MSFPVFPLFPFRSGLLARTRHRSVASTVSAVTPSPPGAGGGANTRPTDSTPSKTWRLRSTAAFSSKQGETKRRSISEFKEFKDSRENKKTEIAEGLGLAFGHCYIEETIADYFRSMSRCPCMQLSPMVYVRRRGIFLLFQDVYFVLFDQGHQLRGLLVLIKGSLPNSYQSLSAFSLRFRSLSLVSVPLRSGAGSPP